MSPKEREIAKDLMALRYRQQIINELLKRKEFGGLPIHVAMGHEAIAVAAHHAVLSGDQLLLTHRNMHFNLARGRSLRPFLDEYKRKEEGVAQGVLGSMNLAQPEHGIPYTSSILGNNMPVACGFALAQSLKKSPGVVWVNTGDGAMEEGTFYESLVFSKTQKLSLIFLIENNDMSMSSTIDERRCQIDVGKMAGAFGIPYENLQGNSTFNYTKRLSDLRNLSRSEQTPVCIEIQTKSYCQHAGPTPGWPTDSKKIDIQNGLIIEESSWDPLYVLKREIPEDIFKVLSEEVFAEDQGVL